MAQQQSFDYYQIPQMPQSMSPPELSPLSFYDNQADFSADSAPSRGSPVSPVFPASSFQLPSGGDWPAYFEKPALSPDLDVFYGEAFGSPMSFLSQNLTLSPTANPADLIPLTRPPAPNPNLNNNRPSPASREDNIRPRLPPAAPTTTAAFPKDLPAQ
ncbi:helix-loop-helix DNA-binding domain-containing protein [Colletotrichum tofieldiae]|nr:helix-loop-helix DNA-binding domain-containing protein [Colletotrichum tofieldiae]